jgi:hypothetical protein
VNQLATFSAVPDLLVMDTSTQAFDAVQPIIPLRSYGLVMAGKGDCQCREIRSCITPFDLLKLSICCLCSGPLVYVPLHLPFRRPLAAYTGKYLPKVSRC